MSSAVLHEDKDVLEVQLANYASLIEERPEFHPNKEAAKAYVIGRDLASTGKFREALSYYLSASELDETSPAPWAAMAITLAAIDKPEASYKAWVETLRRDPTNSKALFMVGLDASMNGDYQNASCLLSRLHLQGDGLPTDNLLRDSALTTALQKIGDLETYELLKVRETALIDNALSQLLQGSDSVWLSVLQQLVDVGNPATALRLAELAIPHLEPKRQSALLSAMPVIEVAAGGDGGVTLSTYMNSAEDGLVYLRPRWSQPTPIAYALSYAAQSMSSVGATDAPIKLYETSLELDPSDVVVINNYSWLLLQRDGASLQAILLAKQAYEADPTAGFVLDTFGYSKLLQGQTSEAIDLFTEALNVTGGNPTILEHLGDAYWNAHQRRDAIASWQKAYGILRSTDHYRMVVEGFQGMEYSVWGISIATSAALYDLELGGVMRRLQQKLTAVQEGKDPFDTRSLSPSSNGQQ